MALTDRQRKAMFARLKEAERSGASRGKQLRTPATLGIIAGLIGVVANRRLRRIRRLGASLRRGAGKQALIRGEQRKKQVDKSFKLMRKKSKKGVPFETIQKRHDAIISSISKEDELNRRKFDNEFFAVRHPSSKRTHIDRKKRQLKLFLGLRR